MKYNKSQEPQRIFVILNDSVKDFAIYSAKDLPDYATRNSGVHF